MRFLGALKLAIPKLSENESYGQVGRDFPIWKSEVGMRLRHNLLGAAKLKIALT